MRSRKTALIGLCALLAGVVPAMAGEVYVPFASNRSFNGTTYQTKVWVSNTGASARKFTVRFITQNVDGTQGAGTGTELSVPAGGTLLLGSVAPSGIIGMLEIDGAPQLVVNARIDAIGGNGSILSSANVPVVAKGNVIKQNATAHIQGIELTNRGTISDLGILNMSNAAAQCTVKAYRSNATQIAQTAVLPLPPLSAVHYENAMAVLGETSISDARFEVTCDRQFFPYALVFEPGGPETNFVTSSFALDGDLVSGVGSSGTVIFESPGLFLHAKPGDSFKQLDIPLVEGVNYRKATVEFDLYVDKFPQGIFAGVTALRRTDRTLYYGLIVRGGRKKAILDMGVDDDTVQGGSGPWKERTNYRLTFEYDIPSRTLTFKTVRSGDLVETLSGRINHLDLSLLDGKKIRVDFGQSGVADGAYFPPIGWKYSNLKVTFEPE